VRWEFEDLYGGKRELLAIFVLNFNRLSFLAKQIAWLRRAGYRNLTVIDNNSTGASGRSLFTSSSCLDRYGQPGRTDTGDGYAADWRVRRVKLVADPDRAHENDVRQLIVELRAVKPPRCRDPRLSEVPTVCLTRSAIDRDSAF
jgi:hypothetical protein